MFTMHHVSATIFLLCAIPGGLVTGCGFYFNSADDCTRNPKLAATPECPSVNESASGTGGGGTPAGCVPHDNDKPVGDECNGVFVMKTGDDNSKDGSRARP